MSRALEKDCKLALVSKAHGNWKGELKQPGALPGKGVGVVVIPMVTHGRNFLLYISQGVGGTTS